MEQQEPSEHNHKARATQPIHGEIKVSGIVEISDAQEATKKHDSEKIADNKYKNDTGDFERRSVILNSALVVVTTLYLAATIAIFYQTKRAAKAAEKAAGVARDALTSTQRPFVGISGDGSFTFTLVKNQSLGATVYAKNFGPAPAINQIAVFKLQTVPKRFPVPNFDSSNKGDAGPPIVLFPGTVSSLTVDTSKTPIAGNVLPKLTDDTIKLIRSGEVRVYLYGSIWYEDSFYLTIHQTDFCFFYNSELSTDSVPKITACPEHNWAN